MLSKILGGALEGQISKRQLNYSEGIVSLMKLGDSPQIRGAVMMKGALHIKLFRFGVYRKTEGNYK